jgi:uncharacterized membrane protein YfcA
MLGAAGEHSKHLGSGRERLYTTTTTPHARCQRAVAAVHNSGPKAAMIDGWVLAVIFIATLIRSALGFGEALVAVPLLALLIPVKVAAPLAVLVSITVAAVIIAQDWHQIHLQSAARLVLSSFAGIPLGLLLLLAAPESVVKGILGVILVAFSLYCLLRRRSIELKDDRLAWLFGFAAGVLGGAYGMNGPPLVIYGILRRWPPEQFRATLQGYFLPASLVGMAGYACAGLWDFAVTRFYLLTLPLAVAAILLGRVIHRRLKGPAFVVYVHIGLIAVGTVLLVQSVWPAPIGGGDDISLPPAWRSGKREGNTEMRMTGDRQSCWSRSQRSRRCLPTCVPAARALPSGCTSCTRSTSFVRCGCAYRTGCAGVSTHSTFARTCGRRSSRGRRRLTRSPRRSI